MHTDESTHPPIELRDDRPRCTNCREYIDDWAVFVRKGFWTGSEFEADPLEAHWCKACYRTHRDREVAVHYEIDDHERLWAILDAADGELVADTYPLTVGGRGYVRIVDGEPQALSIQTKVIHREPRVLGMTAESIEDYDREDFEALFSVQDDGEGDPPRRVFLKPTEETPFDDWLELPDGQTTLELGERR